MAESAETHPSLLRRIHDQRDEESWSRFVEIYAPLVYGYLRKRGLQDADAADLTQDVLGCVAGAIQAFQYDPARGTFRGWLFTIVNNRLRRFFQEQNGQVRGSGDTHAHELLAGQPAPEHDPEPEWEHEYRRHLYQWAVGQVRDRFHDSTWEAFRRTTVRGEPPGEVAESLSLSVAAVYMARRRVMQRIKQLIAEVLGDST